MACPLKTFVERMVREHPAEAAVLASLVLLEILAVGLFGDGDQGEVDEFVLAVNTKLREIAPQPRCAVVVAAGAGRAATPALISARRTEPGSDRVLPVAA